MLDALTLEIQAMLKMSDADREQHYGQIGWKLLIDEYMHRVAQLLA